MVSYRLVFNRKKKPLLSDEKALIQIEAYQQGKRRYFSTNKYVTEKQWNIRSREVKGDKQTNLQLQQQLSALREFEVFFPKTYGRSCTLKDFDLFLTNQTQALAPPQSFSAYMLAEIEAERRLVVPGVTLRKLRVVNRMRDHLGRETMMEDLTYIFLTSFDQALRTRFNLGENTVESMHKVLKQYISRALKSGLLKLNPYDSFKCRGKTVDKVILGEDDIKRLEELSFDEEQSELSTCRDAFLLAYYTMLRISDLTALTPSQVFTTAAGLEIEKKQQKTSQLVRIPLGVLHGGKAQSILYRNWPVNELRPFFSRTHPHLNRQLKKLLKLAKVTKPNLGFHSARHSGITTLVRKGIALAVVQRLAGHSNIKMTMRYVHIAGTDINDALGRVSTW